MDGTGEPLGSDLVARASGVCSFCGRSLFCAGGGPSASAPRRSAPDSGHAWPPRLRAFTIAVLPLLLRHRPHHHLTPLILFKSSRCLLTRELPPALVSIMHGARFGNRRWGRAKEEAGASGRQTLVFLANRRKPSMVAGRSSTGTSHHLGISTTAKHFDLHLHSHRWVVEGEKVDGAVSQPKGQCPGRTLPLHGHCSCG